MIINADAIQWAKEYEGELFHALICDPPYHLTTITDRFGKEDSAPAKHGNDGAFKRLSTGFMGKVWDGGDIAFQSETWKAFYNILLPGAFGMAFGGSRTAHRMAVAIEDAGFIIHPQMSWVYGSGFPKATRIDTQVDSRGGQNIGWFGSFMRKWRKERGVKQKELAKYFPSKTGGLTGCVANWELGYNLPTVEQFNILKDVLNLPFDSIQAAEREVVGEQTKARKTDSGIPLPTGGETEYQTWDITAPATDLAKQWEGHRYGLQALKPAAEPIVVFQKPYEGRPIDNITETGAGAINIDGGRIGTGERFNSPAGNTGDEVVTYAPTGESAKEKGYEGNTVQGRWPANVLFTHSPDCEAIGYRDSGSYQINRFTEGAKPFGDGAGHEFESEEVEGGRVPVWECVDGCPVKALDKQSGRLTSGKPTGNRNAQTGFSSGITPGKMKLTGFGDSGTASRFFHQSHWAIENADPFVYQAKVSVSERNAGLKEFWYDWKEISGGGGTNQDVSGGYQAKKSSRNNPHPTLKPIALIEHLATLLLPPKEYAPRRIFVPFAGVSSEVIGCWRAGWEEITGIELESEYAEIGKARLEYWKKQGIQLELL